LSIEESAERERCAAAAAPVDVTATAVQARSGAAPATGKVIERRAKPAGGRPKVIAAWLAAETATLFVCTVMAVPPLVALNEKVAVVSGDASVKYGVKRDGEAEYVMPLPREVK